MYKAFAIAGYSAAEVEARFGGMLNAFKYGAPPHGGSAPGIDRIVMLLADTPNIREVVTFPMNQQAQDLMMQAPAAVPPERLRELHIALRLPPNAKPCARVLPDVPIRPLSRRLTRRRRAAQAGATFRRTCCGRRG